ncbi:MAG: PIN domain-containing protein [Candidatus Aenigmarchaeota archaeon]|nr:PIN domain-containing protein [Candidatus Aenigmarchaeota archaeon]
MITFIDSNIIIFSNIQEYPEHETTVKKLEEILSNGKGAVNSIIMSEVYHKLSKILDKKQAKSRTKKILDSENILYFPIEKPTIEKAIKLSGKSQLRINDSVIGQHVIDTNADGIFTDNVKDFKKIDKLKIIRLRGSKK